MFGELDCFFFWIMSLINIIICVYNCLNDLGMGDVGCIIN